MQVAKGWGARVGKGCCLHAPLLWLLQEHLAGPYAIQEAGLGGPLAWRNGVLCSVGYKSRVTAAAAFRALVPLAPYFLFNRTTALQGLPAITITRDPLTYRCQGVNWEPYAGKNVFCVDVTVCRKQNTGAYEQATAGNWAQAGQSTGKQNYSHLCRWEGTDTNNPKELGMGNQLVVYCSK